MAGRRLSVAVAVGLVGLGAPAAGAAASNPPAWGYVVTSANGSATWRYSGANGSGMDTVTFQGHARRGVPAAGISSALRGRASYTDQNSHGCGPITHTKRKSYRGPSFSVQDPSVVVRWTFPLPTQSYCSDPMPTSIARQLQGLLVEKIPVARFTCERMLLNLGGQAQLTQGPVTWKVTYHAAVIIKRI